jgi:hypothetical protein
MLFKLYFVIPKFMENAPRSFKNTIITRFEGKKNL